MRKGIWLNAKEDGSSAFDKCSICGYEVHYTQIEYKSDCPRCGAKNTYEHINAIKRRQSNDRTRESNV